MYSFKFYYLEACDSLKIRQNEKLLSRVEESTNTTNLNLSNIELTDNTCKAVGHALRKDVFLQELDLSNCMLRDEGLSSIVSGLEANKFLLTLNLKGNNIRSAGTAVIGKLLRHNNHLQNLYLEWNSTGIFPEKFSYLCEGLSVNTSLKSLDLRNNQLNHVCAQSLSDVIYRNSTLQYLDLRWNSIGLIGGREILKKLSKNKSILKLDIDGNDVPLEIRKSIEFITAVNAERYLKSSEDMKKTRLFASKFQQLEGDRDKQLKILKEQLDKKDKVIETSERWNASKLYDLEDALLERDKLIDELTKKSKEYQKRISIITEEKNDTALSLNEMEVKHKELKKEFHLLLEKEKKSTVKSFNNVNSSKVSLKSSEDWIKELRKIREAGIIEKLHEAIEREDIERKLVEELGIIKQENLHLKQKLQELEFTKESLDDQVVSLKKTISEMKKTSKLEEKSYEDQILTLKEKYQEKLKELDQLKENEIKVQKEEFSEMEKNLKERIVFLENRKRDLELQIIEKDDLISANKVQTQKEIDGLKKKMEEDKNKLEKQMRERIELLESANKKQEELLHENLEAFHEIQTKSTENDLLLAEEHRRTQKLEHMLESKDAEMNASISKVKLEVSNQMDKLNEDNNSLKLKIEDMVKLHKEELQSKDEDIKILQKKIQNLKMKLKEVSQNEMKRIDELQNAFASWIKCMKQETDKEIDLEN